jgi:hypothetical protein
MRQAGTTFVLLCVALLLAGCRSWARYGSDLVAPDNITQSEQNIREAFNELSAESTVADGRAWFKRHGIPLEEHSVERDEQRLVGGFDPFDSLGPLPGIASVSLHVALTFTPDGRFLRGTVSYSAATL